VNAVIEIAVSLTVDSLRSAVTTISSILRGAAPDSGGKESVAA
jgi:hypothetical protein